MSVGGKFPWQKKMGPNVQSKGEVSGCEKLKQLRHIGAQARVKENLEMKQESRQDSGGGGVIPLPPVDTVFHPKGVLPQLLTCPIRVFH